MMLTLAVTGGIGSGKSLACSFFEERGVPVYCSDERTKSLYDRLPGLVDRISEVLGCRVSDASGRLDRSLLASVVFSDPHKLSLLESVVHPEVLKDFQAWKSAQGQLSCGFVVMESAIILEKPLFMGVADKLLVVDAPVRLRLERACARDHADEALIRARMDRQVLLNGISDGTYDPHADFLIRNEGSAGDLERQVEEIYRELVSLS